MRRLRLALLPIVIALLMLCYPLLGCESGSPAALPDVEAGEETPPPAEFVGTRIEVLPTSVDGPGLDSGEADLIRAAFEGLAIPAERSSLENFHRDLGGRLLAIGEVKAIQQSSTPTQFVLRQESGGDRWKTIERQQHNWLLVFESGSFLLQSTFEKAAE